MKKGKNAKARHRRAIDNAVISTVIAYEPDEVQQTLEFLYLAALEGTVMESKTADQRQDIYAMVLHIRDSFRHLNAVAAMYLPDSRAFIVMH